MKILSVVCARSGSKGLKNKCVQKINSKMIIEFSISYSLSLGKNVKTVVSTNISEVIDYCKKNDICYIKRGPALCNDRAKIEDVLRDAIEKSGLGYDYCSLVYGNIPLRYPEIFHKAIKFLKNHKDYDAAISMQDVGKFNPQWMFDYNGQILPKVKADTYRRQDLPAKIIHDGHTLIFRCDKFLKRHKGLISFEDNAMYSVFGDKIKPLINKELIVDIDTDKDMMVARGVILSGGRIR